MCNIEKYITYSPSGNTDSRERAREIDNCDIDQVRHEASRHGMEISEHHLEVINYLRDYYVQNGWPRRTHELSRILDKAYKHLGEKKISASIISKWTVSTGRPISRPASTL